ncbi:hypothetical protein BY458DRAFT_488940 [Sporodiniella umbellata]|nr:hypothetical protein BY458DRAFT_488940 [Sporodiniella umbellata]
MSILKLFVSLTLCSKSIRREYNKGAFIQFLELFHLLYLMLFEKFFLVFQCRLKSVRKFFPASFESNNHTVPLCFVSFYGALPGFAMIGCRLLLRLCSLKPHFDGVRLYTAQNLWGGLHSKSKQAVSKTDVWSVEAYTQKKKKKHPWSTDGCSQLSFTVKSVLS